MPKYTSSHLFCGHCKEFLGKSTFYKHKRRYYNVSNGTWQLAEAASTPKPNKTRSSHPSVFQDDMSFDDDFSEPSLPTDQGKSTLLTV